MLKLLFSLLIGVATASAATLTVNLDFPTLAVAPGQTVTFSGTISNGFADAVDLNSLNVNLSGSGFTVDPTPFFFGPLTVDGNATTVNFSFFSVAVDDPFAFPSGLYSGTIDVLGGVQVGGIPDPTVQNLLGQAAFEVNVLEATQVPEPASAPLLLVTGAALGLYRLRCVR